MTAFHFVRHAAHDLLGRALTGRMTGVGLNEAGRNEAERLAERFSGREIAAVLSSPSQRAVETAEPIARRLNLIVEIGEEFDEIDFGRWMGLSFEALNADPLWTRWNEKRAATRCPDGETMLEAQTRIIGRMEREEARFPHRDVIVVSHCDMIKAALAWGLRLSLDDLARFQIDPASISVMRIEPWGVRIESLNEIRAP